MPTHNKHRIHAVFVLSIFFFGCSPKENVIVNHAPVAEMQIVQGLNQFSLDATSSHDQDGNRLSFKWSSSSNKISISSPASPKTSFDIPLEPQSFSVDITLEVTDGNLSNSTTQTVLVPSLNQLEAYGLGHQLTIGVSNNVDYEWYFDQGNSGTFSLVNCGPTSATMAIKWADKTFMQTPENARQTYRSTGGWWYTNDIINYLNDFKVNNYTINLTDINLLKDKIKNKDIVILCLDMYYVEQELSATYHVSKFYRASTAGWGHFIIVKGYKEVDGQTFFEAYDPYDFANHYPDNSLKGRDRYYKAANLDDATNFWWDYAIIVSKQSLSGGRTAWHPDAINTSSILHRPGK